MNVMYNESKTNETEFKALAVESFGFRRDLIKSGTQTFKELKEVMLYMSDPTF
ncbi:unnamed protein product, partial [Didymodactylos carnosus]